jgi:HSP20 family protein
MAGKSNMITVILKPGLSRHFLAGSDDPSKFLGHQMNYRLNANPHSWSPPVDIYETEKNLIVLVEIAGMREVDFSISFDRNIILINGVRSSPLSERIAVHQLEIPFGEFSTEIEFSVNIDTNTIEATYQNGFLRINLLKSHPKPIQIAKD